MKMLASAELAIGTEEEFAVNIIVGDIAHIRCPGTRVFHFHGHETQRVDDESLRETQAAGLSCV